MEVEEADDKDVEEADDDGEAVKAAAAEEVDEPAGSRRLEDLLAMREEGHDVEEHYVHH